MKTSTLLIIGLFVLILNSGCNSNRDSWNRGVALLEQAGLNPHLLPNDAPSIYYGTIQDSKAEAAVMLKQLRVQQAGAQLLIRHGYPAEKIPYLRASQLIEAARLRGTDNAKGVRDLIESL